MKKILVVFTGGTIGSAVADGTINTSSKAAFTLLQRFEERCIEASAIHFDTLQPFEILSENLVPTAWKLLIEAINSAQQDKYDGIIITHGTDTLAYTACALSFYFHALKKPILLVSSDYPLDNSSGNGLANFMCAVEFIRQEIAYGVFVPYCNAGHAMQIHRGSRLTCSLQLTGDFFSVQNNSFMQFDGRSFSFINGRSQSSQNGTAIHLTLKPEFSNRILMVKPYPGLDYCHFNLDGVEAVLHDLYHSGTACATELWGNQHSLVEFLKVCRDNNIPVFLAPASKLENAYQSTRNLLEHGAEMIWNMSIEAAYVKLMLAAGNYSGKHEMINFINLDIAHEHILR
jgi:L-asparaginase/Glu-tRNA(Gln) amidotransferase subunit D